MKKIISIVLIVFSVLTMSIPALAQTRTVTYRDAYVDYNHSDTVAPCIRKAQTESSDVVVNLDVARPIKIEVKFDTNKPTWPHARYKNKEGYISFNHLKFDAASLAQAMFTGNNLYQGDTGNAVYNLQGCLNLYRNYGLTVDGQFGAATKNAVKSFQSSVGLYPDGIAGINTQKALLEKLGVVKM